MILGLRSLSSSIKFEHIFNDFIFVCIRIVIVMAKIIFSNILYVLRNLLTFSKLTSSIYNSTEIY
jgi:hypothetical protein